jgi:hypothetical protein
MLEPQRFNPSNMLSALACAQTVELRRFRRGCLAVLSLISICTLGACASVDVKPLDADGNKVKSGADAGLRYYIPKPYLLVMRLPPDTPAGAQSDVTVQDPVADHATSAPPPASHPAPGGSSSGHSAPTAAAHPNSSSGAPDTPSKNSPAPPDSSAPAAGVASTQFSASNSRYVAKLVYLPDLSRPMAISTTTGLGAVTLGASLQEGWMLTSLQTSSDSKTAEILTAIAAGIGATHGGGGGGGTGGKQQPGGGPNTLPPGLYMFDYGPKGTVAGLCYVTLFEAPTKDWLTAEGLPKACAK